MTYPVGHEVHLRPLLSRFHLALAHTLFELMPIVLWHIVDRLLQLRRNIHTDRELDHPEAFVSALGEIPEQLPLEPAVSDLTRTPSNP